MTKNNQKDCRKQSNIKFLIDKSNEWTIISNTVSEIREMIMGTREDAQEMLNKLSECRSKSFSSKIDESQKGVGFVLVFLQKATHEVFAGDLARELNVSTARIAALLRKMEKGGLIVRHRSPVDARQTVVEITQEGRAHVDRMREQILTKMELLLEKVGREDMEEFIRISHKIKDVFDG